MAVFKENINNGFVSRNMLKISSKRKKEKMTWISIKKRLPKEANFYLIYRLTLGRPTYTIAWYAPGYGWSHFQDECAGSVTHWATIPEPPSRET